VRDCSVRLNVIRGLKAAALSVLGLLVFPLHARWTRLLLKPPKKNTPAGRQPCG
jgi:hypothetical protein